MLVSDIEADASAVIGCDGTTLLSRLSEAIDILANSGDGNWDGLVGTMDIAATGGVVTLPRDILKPISINVDGIPIFPRDRWFEFHVNGPGGQTTNYAPAWDDRGTYQFIRDIETASNLKIVASSSTDNAVVVKFWYVDEADHEQTLDYTINYAAPTTTALSSKVMDLRKFWKPVTAGNLSVYSVDGSGVETLVGYYYADEKTPYYRRIRIPSWDQEGITMIYRRATRELRSTSDYIPLKSKMAVIQALWSVKYRYQGNIEKAHEAQMDAVMLLEQDQFVRAITNSPVGPQVLDYSSDVNERLRGYTSTPYRYHC